jgi:fructose-1,6-bisphosphatase/sedoheptulose 1,7-bisphosphatase-like protein
VSVEAEVTSTFCGGNAGPDDVHLAATVRCMDGEIAAWLEQRERRKRRRKERRCRSY